MDCLILPPQLLNEAFSWLAKRWIKAERPYRSWLPPPCSSYKTHLPTLVESMGSGCANLISLLSSFCPRADVHLHSHRCDPADGSPSSHSQFMGFLFAFVTLHLLVVQKVPARWTLSEQHAWNWKRAVVIVGIGAWSAAVAFSRSVCGLQRYFAPPELTPQAQLVPLLPLLGPNPTRLLSRRGIRSRFLPRDRGCSSKATG